MYLAFTNSCSISPPDISKNWFSFPFYRQGNWVSEYYGIITSVTKIFIESKICQLCKISQAFAHNHLIQSHNHLVQGGTIIIPLNRSQHSLSMRKARIQTQVKLFQVSIFKHRWKPEAEKGQILSYKSQTEENLSPELSDSKVPVPPHTQERLFSSRF